jgi:hypothetical protein
MVDPIRATALLVGGPTTIPDELRKRPVVLPCEKIKIEHRGGYEHFVPAADDPDPGAEIVFEWVTRTRIAE